MKSVTLEVQCQREAPLLFDSPQERHRAQKEAYKLACVGTFVPGEWCIERHCPDKLVREALVAAKAMSDSIAQPSTEPGC